LTSGSILAQAPGKLFNIQEMIPKNTRWLLILLPAFGCQHASQELTFPEGVAVGCRTQLHIVSNESVHEGPEVSSVITEAFLSPDKRWIAVATLEPTPPEESLWGEATVSLVRADGKTTLIDRSTDVFYGGPCVSADSKYLAYTLVERDDAAMLAASEAMPTFRFVIYDVEQQRKVEDAPGYALFWHDLQSVVVAGPSDVRLHSVGSQIKPYALEKEFAGARLTFDHAGRGITWKPTGPRSWEVSRVNENGKASWTFEFSDIEGVQWIPGRDSIVFSAWSEQSLGFASNRRLYRLDLTEGVLTKVLDSDCRTATDFQGLRELISAREFIRERRDQSTSSPSP
jgi:hypothetical protein